MLGGVVAVVGFGQHGCGLVRRLEFHYTPKHASWPNMVEIQIGVMVSQCLDRRIPTKAMLVSEVKA